LKGLILIQTFDSVIPSERTRVTVKIVDGSVCGVAPTHQGSIVLYIEELDFTTDIVGDSPEFLFHLLVPSASFLFIDVLSGPYEGAGAQQAQMSSVSRGTSYWKVRLMIKFLCSKLMGTCREQGMLWLLNAPIWI
jgi:autophagy-related protein 2